MQELKRWHDWEVTEFLGRGSFGEVYQIERNAFGHTYKSALKVIRIPVDASEYDNVISSGMTEQDAKEYFQGMAESISKEFALMSELRGNSNIVSFEDFEVIHEDDGYTVTIYIRMELLKPLIKHMRDSSMTKRDVIHLGCDILKALELCEQRNIIHRDIKPENVFVSDQGTYKLGDFGIARELEQSTMGMSKKGTLSYMAPEIYRGENYDSTVDIYSLGIMLYRLMNNNRLPFMPPYPEKISYTDTHEANTRRYTGEEMPLPCNAQDELGRIILRACSFNPEDRYQTAAEMRRDLENYNSGRKSLIPEQDDYEDEEGTVSYPKEAGIAAAAGGMAKKEEDPEEKTANKFVMAGRSHAPEKSVTDVQPSPVKQDKAEVKAESIPQDKKEIDTGKAQDKKDKKKEKAEKKAAEKPIEDQRTKKPGKGKFAVIAAVAAVALLVFAVLTGALNGKVEIAGYEYDKDSSSIFCYSDELTAEDFRNLDKFKELERVELENCTLDNGAIAALGNTKTGITQLIMTQCSGFDDISPLADMPFLGFLNASNCGITDEMLEATDFSKMEHLAALRLSDNEGISSLKPIEPVIPQLKGLGISCTSVSDISALSNAGELQALFATDCGIDDISAVTSKKMRYMRLSRNNISDISITQDMPDLNVLIMPDNNISDLTPLTGLQDLDTVSISGNHVSDLSPLGKCPALTSLYVCGNELESLEGLSGHSTLGELYVSDNKLTSLKGIEGELELNSLAAARNKLTDLEGAENITQLVRVNLRGNSIEDVSLLKKSRDKLQWVDISDNPVGSLDALNNTFNLKGVYCDNTGIKSLDPVLTSLDLETISAQNNGLTSIEGLEALKKLETLDVSGNKIKSVEPLAVMVGEDAYDILLDLRDNDIETLAFPEADASFHIAITGNPLKNVTVTDTQKADGTGADFFGFDYYDDFNTQGWTDALQAWTELHIVGCPMDKRVNIKDGLKGIVSEDHIFFSEKKDVDDYMKPMLRNARNADSTENVDTKYGENYVAAENSDANELDPIQEQTKE